MKFYYTKTVSALAILAASLTTQAEIIYFDDYTSDLDFVTLTGPYSGFDWINTGVTNGTNPNRINTGYNNGTISPDYAIFNLSERQITITRTNDEDFDFNSGYFSGAWNNDLNIKLTGWNDGSQIYEQVIQGQTTNATFYDLSFDNIDELQISAYGGTPQPGLTGTGTHFVIDNFSYTIPEPTTMACLMLGFIALLKRK